MKNIVLLFLISANSVLYAQDRSVINVAIGSNMMTSTGGTLNLYSEVTIFRYYGINAGIGIMPFGYFADITNRNPASGTANFGRLNIQGGSCVSFGIKRFTEFTSRDETYAYGSIAFRRWTYNLAAINDTDGKRFKVIIGGGIKTPINRNLGIDVNIGVSFVEDQLQIENVIDYSNNAVSLDLGLNIYYVL